MLSVWSSVLVLVTVGLSLGKAPSAPTPQDCESMTRPLTLMDNTAKLSGGWTLIEGITNQDDTTHNLKMLQSSWTDITPSAEDNTTLIIQVYERFNGTCISDKANMTMISNTAGAMDTWMSGGALYNFLSTCVNCLVVEQRIPLHTTPNLYMYARGRSLNESDLEVFHQQAKCMNLTRSPAFHYDQEQGSEFCRDCETVVTPLTLNNADKLSGRWTLIGVFSDDVNGTRYMRILSSWLDITPSAEDNTTLIMTEYNRYNGTETCDSVQSNMTIVSDTAGAIDFWHGSPARFKLLSTCADCLVIDLTTPVQNLLMYVRRGSLKKHDLTAFHEQAMCIIHPDSPAYYFDLEQEFCPEDNKTTP